MPCFAYPEHAAGVVPQLSSVPPLYELVQGYFISIFFLLFTEQDICTFTNYFREQFPQATIPPKLHMLEDHVVSFIQKWHFPLGFFGKQGGESIHHEFVDLAATFAHVHPAPDRLKRILEKHFVVVHPKNREIIPQKQCRNLKRQREDL